MKLIILCCVLSMLAKGGLATQKLRHLHTDPPLEECAYDCDEDTHCQPGLLCADEHKPELTAAGLDKRKANCPEPNGPEKLEVCYDPGKVIAFTLNTRTLYNYYFPYPQYLPVDPDDENSPKFLRLTSDGYTAAGVSALTKYRFNPDNTQKGFSMNAEYRMHCNFDACTDGLTFVMHQDPRGVDAVGMTSGGLGVYNDDPPPLKGSGEAIRPSLIVELDRWPNWTLLDRGTDHQDSLHVVTISSDETLTSHGETLLNDGALVTDPTQPGRFWVDFHPSAGTVEVYLDTAGGTKPASPQLTATGVDLTDLFDGNEVYVGFTAGVHTKQDIYDIMSWSFGET